MYLCIHTDTFLCSSECTDRLSLVLDVKFIISTQGKPMDYIELSAPPSIMGIGQCRRVSLKTANSTVKASYYYNQKCTTIEADTVTTVNTGSIKL